MDFSAHRLRCLGECGLAQHDAFLAKIRTKSVVIGSAWAQSKDPHTIAGLHPYRGISITTTALTRSGSSP